MSYSPYLYNSSVLPPFYLGILKTITIPGIQLLSSEPNLAPEPWRRHVLMLALRKEAYAHSADVGVRLDR